MAIYSKLRGLATVFGFVWLTAGVLDVHAACCGFTWLSRVTPQRVNHMLCLHLNI